MAAVVRGAGDMVSPVLAVGYHPAPCTLPRGGSSSSYSAGAEMGQPWAAVSCSCITWASQREPPGTDGLRLQWMGTPLEGEERCRCREPPCKAAEIRGCYKQG